MTERFSLEDILTGWKYLFEACEHKWESFVDKGEDGQLCRKCGGWTSNKNFSIQFGKPAPSR